jgi:hypothetical protein
LLKDVFCGAFFYPHLQLDRILSLIEIIVLHERKMWLNFLLCGSPIGFFSVGLFLCCLYDETSKLADKISECIKVGSDLCRVFAIRFWAERVLELKLLCL